MIRTIVSDSVWQMGIVGVVLGTIVLLLVLRTEVVNHPGAVARGTQIVLVMGVLSVLLLSGWTGWNALSRQRGSGSVVPSPVASSSSVASPTATPTQAPSPTPTPHLARSITQVLTTFCNAITARNYQTAWSVSSTSLQSRHSYAMVVVAWGHYTACSIPDQVGDPDAIAVLTFTLAPGEKDQYGFTGDTSLRFTMGIEAQAWRIAAVCHEIAEGCFGLAWG